MAACAGKLSWLQKEMSISLPHCAQSHVYMQNKSFAGAMEGWCTARVPARLFCLTVGYGNAIGAKEYRISHSTSMSSSEEVGVKYSRLDKL
jgi:hypothetical protein